MTFIDGCVKKSRESPIPYNYIQVAAIELISKNMFMHVPFIIPRLQNMKMIELVAAFGFFANVHGVTLGPDQGGRELVQSKCETKFEPVHTHRDDIIPAIAEIFKATPPPNEISEICDLLKAYMAAAEIPDPNKDQVNMRTQKYEAILKAMEGIKLMRATAHCLRGFCSPTSVALFNDCGHSREIQSVCSTIDQRDYKEFCQKVTESVKG